YSTSCRNTHFVSTPCTSSSSSYSGPLSQPAYDTIVLVGGTGCTDAPEVLRGDLSMWDPIAASCEHSSVDRVAELRRFGGDPAFANQQAGDAASVHAAPTRA